MHHSKGYCFFDLDGTLVDSSINNTYHFILLYAKTNEYNLRTKIYFILIKFLPLISRIHRLLRLDRFKVSIDSILITVLFFGYKVEDLIRFSSYWIHALKTRAKLRKISLGYINYCKLKGYRTILLTACTEIPACILAKYLGLDDCFARRFKIYKGMIIGLKDYEPTPLLKLKFLIESKELKNAFKIYIVDEKSALNESSVLKMFNLLLII